MNLEVCKKCIGERPTVVVDCSDNPDGRSFVGINMVRLCTRVRGIDGLEMHCCFHTDLAVSTSFFDGSTAFYRYQFALSHEVDSVFLNTIKNLLNYSVFQIDTSNEYGGYWTRCPYFLEHEVCEWELEQ